MIFVTGDETPIRYEEPHSRYSAAEWVPYGGHAQSSQVVKASGGSKKKINSNIFVDPRGPLLIDFLQTNMTGTLV